MTPEEEEARGQEIDERTDVLQDRISEIALKTSLFPTSLNKRLYMEIIEAHEEIAKLMREIVNNFPSYQNMPD